jgi:hypothetical protein
VKGKANGGSGPKSGKLMPGSTRPASAGGGRPPKTTVGIVKSPKSGK